MFRFTSRLAKAPVIMKIGGGMYTEQLKHLLRKEPLYKRRWQPLTMYDPRKLWHANRVMDPIQGTERWSPHWDRDTYWVPDQHLLKVPVPSMYKDAYWAREKEARRVQLPIEKVQDQMYSPQLRKVTDFQDLSFRKRFRFSDDEVIANLKRQRQ